MGQNLSLWGNNYPFTSYISIFTSNTWKKIDKAVSCFSCSREYDHTPMQKPGGHGISETLRVSKVCRPRESHMDHTRFTAVIHIHKKLNIYIYI